MQSIIDFLSSVGEAILAAIDFVISFFGDLIYIIQLTGKILTYIPGYFSWLPAEAVTVITVIFSLVVIYKITGREG